MNQSHGHGHDHNHNHHNHGAHHHDSKLTEADVCIVENREVEANSKLDRSAVANHVWKTCRTANRFMMKSPTVSVRRVQLMRAQLQFNPREWENETFQEEPSEANCPKPPKTKVGCKCAAAAAASGGRRSSFYSANSSVSDVMHACPDECNDVEETTEKEDEESVECNL